MARSRGEANQALYRARILLHAWDQSRGDVFPEEQLLGAFMPAVKLHLRESYGWFLLAVSGAADADRVQLPGGVDDLPPPESGRSRSPELIEFATLESEGWVRDMLADESTAPTVVAPAMGSGGLIGSDRTAPGYAVAREWSDKLSATMARMDDSLNEC